jgi:hypothetical protein
MIYVLHICMRLYTLYQVFFAVRCVYMYLVYTTRSSQVKYYYIYVFIYMFYVCDVLYHAIYV